MASITGDKQQTKQDYQTPDEFLVAICKRLDILGFDLDVAASEDNVAFNFYNEEKDGLQQNWWSVGWTWCNPPYKDIRPWVQKAWEESQQNKAKIAMLIPASVGANWWKEWVHDKAHTLFLNGRITFVGHTTPYPKDCALLLYTPYIMGGYEVWDWRNNG